MVAPSGHAAHPNEIIESCQALQAHIVQVQDDAEKKIREWEKELKDQELAEKRRVAPGWLDREEKILQPKRTSGSAAVIHSEGAGQGTSLLDQQIEKPQLEPKCEEKPNPAGEELDRAFGGMGLSSG